MLAVCHAACHAAKPPVELKEPARSGPSAVPVVDATLFALGEGKERHWFEHLPATL